MGWLKTGEAGMSEPEQRLTGRTALITGGGRGIGRAVALAYARQGADVALLARTPLEIEEVAAEIISMGRRALVFPADVRNPDDVQQACQQMQAAWGRIDILFAAAGLRAVYPSHELPIERWQEVLDVNLTGSLLCCQGVFPAMQAASYGKIILVGSMQAHSGAPNRAAYIASKTGLFGLAHALGVEWARYGINVNLLSPGYIDTDIIRRQMAIGQLDLAAIERRTPLGRLGRLEDITGPAVFLASGESDFMCAQSLVIDGGWLAYGFL
jgi:NAD(P)-dependent dehydrogenase (short-subunit alcohol dehydrogenase family)